MTKIGRYLNFKKEADAVAIIRSSAVPEDHPICSAPPRMQSAESLPITKIAFHMVVYAFRKCIYHLSRYLLESAQKVYPKRIIKATPREELKLNHANMEAILLGRMRS